VGFSLWVFSLVLLFGCGYLLGFCVGTYWVLSVGFQVGLPKYTF
jgi:hypothetical protein